MAHQHHETNYRANLPRPFCVTVHENGTLTAEFHQIAAIAVGHKTQELVLVPVGAIVDPPSAEPIIIGRASYDHFEVFPDPLLVEEENCSLR